MVPPQSAVWLRTGSNRCADFLTDRSFEAMGHIVASTPVTPCHVPPPAKYGPYNSIYTCHTLSCAAACQVLMGHIIASTPVTPYHVPPPAKYGSYNRIYTCHALTPASWRAVFGSLDGAIQCLVDILSVRWLFLIGSVPTDFCFFSNLSAKTPLLIFIGHLVLEGTSRFCTKSAWRYRQKIPSENGDKLISIFAQRRRNRTRLLPNTVSSLADFANRFLPNFNPRQPL